MTGHTVVVIVDSAQAATDVETRLKAAGFGDLTIIDARNSASIYRHKGLEIDLNDRKVRLDGRDIGLTSHEFALVAYLARHSGKIRTFAEIFESAWARPYTGEATYLWTYMRRLRGKLEADPQHPIHLLSRHGCGYFMPPPDPAAITSLAAPV